MKANLKILDSRHKKEVDKVVMKFIKLLMINRCKYRI